MERSSELKSILKLLSVFPLRVSKLEANMTLGESIDLFGSLMVIRIESYLKEHFPSVDFSNLTEHMSFVEISDHIISTLRSQDEYVVSADNYQDARHLWPTNSEFQYDPSYFNINYSNVGIDIESIDALPENIFSFHQASLRNRLFRPEEVVHALNKSFPRLSLLGIYCAKEAIVKSSPAWLHLTVSRLLIQYNASGKPYCRLSTNDYAINYDISISHAKCYACAVSICTLRRL